MNDEPLLTAEGVTKHFPVKGGGVIRREVARVQAVDEVSLEVRAVRDFFKNFGKDRLPQDHVEEYSKANIAFHQALISLMSRRFWST